MKLFNKFCKIYPWRIINIIVPCLLFLPLIGLILKLFIPFIEIWYLFIPFLIAFSLNTIIMISIFLTSESKF